LSYFVERVENKKRLIIIEPLRSRILMFTSLVRANYSGGFGLIEAEREGVT